MQSAGVTLVKGDLRGIERAISLSRAVMRNIRQNLFFAFIYNALGIPLAAGALYPFFGWLLSPIICWRGNEPQLRVRDRQCPPPAEPEALNITRRGLRFAQDFCATSIPPPR